MVVLQLWWSTEQKVQGGYLAETVFVNINALGSMDFISMMPSALFRKICFKVYISIFGFLLSPVETVLN
jgi:hypothetical protein